MLIGLSVASIAYGIAQTNSEDGWGMYQHDVYIVTPCILAVTFVSAAAIGLQ